MAQLLVGCGGRPSHLAPPTAGSAGTPSSALPTSPTVPPAARPAAAPLPDLDPAAVTPDPDEVQRLLAGPLANPHLRGPSAYVVDAITGQVLLDRDGASASQPASTVKTVVGAAALASLGPTARLRTRVLRSGDALWLVGAGDPTLTAANSAPYPSPARLGDLVHQVRAAGVRAVSRVVGDASLFAGPATAPGWKQPYLSEGDVAPVSALEVDEGRTVPGASGARRTAPDTAAAQALATALRTAGIRVGGIGTGRAPAGAVSIAAVDSPPIPVLVEWMLTVSDNDLAEALGRLVALNRGAPPTFAGAATSTLRVLAELGVPDAGASLSDTSGLSTLDRIAPATLVALLRIASSSAHPELRPLLTGLPVAGFSGTLDDRYRHGPARLGAGRVRAKTGSLASVTSLAGAVLDVDGRLLLFAFFAQVPESGQSKATLDRAAAALAGCGCTARSPVGRSPPGQPTGPNSSGPTITGGSG